jgi:cell pole-organizing protein PopZ
MQAMAEATDATAAAEPSMEEILASIRKIIADDKPPAPEDAANGEDVLELTQMVQDDGSVVDLTASGQEEPEPAAVVEEPPAPAEPVATAAPPPAVPESDENLVSATAATAASSALAALASTVQTERRAAMPIMTPVGNGARTLEDMAMELMRPMLKAWLDQNLPPLVERAVQKEVERIARRAQD